MGKTLNLSEHRAFLPDEMGLFCFIVSMQETPLLRRSAKRQAEGFAYDFVVGEVVLHALDDLIILMALAGNQDDIARLRHGAGSAYSLAAIHNADDTASLACIKAG